MNTSQYNTYREIMRASTGDEFFAKYNSIIDNKFDNDLNESIVAMQMMGGEL